MVCTLPGRTHGLGLITKSLLAELHLDSGLFATMNLWATLLGAAFCVPFGRLIDRFGTRIVLAAVGLTLGLVVLAMSRVNGPLSLFVTITLSRGLGQSALSVVSLAIVGKWFVRRVGLAMGIYSFLVAGGFMTAFAIFREILPQVEWSTTWSGIGYFLLFGLVPLAWLLPKPTHSVAKDEAAPESGAAAVGLSLSEALLTPAFWVFAVASSTYLLISSGVSLFNELILNDLGFERRTYHTALIYATGAGLVSNFLGGWMAQRWSMGKVMGLAMGLLAAALLAFPNLKTETQVYIQASVMGMAGGIVTVVFFSVWSKAFGRVHLGKIQGAAQMMTVLASAAGPLVFDTCKHQSGSYTLIFYALCPIVAALGVGAWLVRLPVPKDASLSVNAYGVPALQGD
jgi:MFS family permease